MDQEQPPLTLGTQQPAPARRTYWVTPMLLAGCYPGLFVGDLIDGGIRHFLNLQPEDELGQGGRPFPEYLDHRFIGLADMTRVPFPDMGVPTRQEMVRALDDIDAALASGRPTYVHCWGGQGRTGTLVGCWMVRHGLVPPTAAVATIERLRAGCADVHKPSPQTAEQHEMIRSWRPGQ